MKEHAGVGIRWNQDRGSKMASAEEARMAMLSVSSLVKDVIGKGGKIYAKDSLSEIGRLFEQAEKSYREGDFDDTVGYAKRVARLAEEARTKCETAQALNDRISVLRDKLNVAIQEHQGTTLEEDLLRIESLLQRSESILKNKTGLQEGIWLVEEAEELLFTALSGGPAQNTDLDESHVADDIQKEEQEEEQEEPLETPPAESISEEPVVDVLQEEKVVPELEADLSQLRVALAKAQERLTHLEKAGAIEVTPAMYRKAFRSLTDAEDLLAEDDHDETRAALRSAEEAMQAMEQELTRSTDAQKDIAESQLKEIQEILVEIDSSGGKRFVEESVGVVLALMESSKIDVDHHQWELALGKLDRSLNNAQDALDESKRMRLLENSYRERWEDILPNMERLKEEEAEKYGPQSFFEADRDLTSAKELAEENRFEEACEFLSKARETIAACETEIRQAKAEEARRRREDAMTQRLDALEGTSLDELEAQGAPSYLPNEYKMVFKSLNAVRRALRRGELDEAEESLRWSEQAMEKLRSELVKAKDKIQSTVEGLLSKSSQILAEIEAFAVAQLKALQIRAIKELLIGLRERGESSWKAVEQQAKNLMEQITELREELLVLQTEMEEVDRRKPDIAEGVRKLMESGAESYVREAWKDLMTLKERAQQSQETGDFRSTLECFDKMNAMFPKLMAETQQEKEREKQEALGKLSTELDLLEKELEEMEKLEVIQYMPTQYRTVCKAFKEAGQAFRREEVDSARKAITEAQEIIKTLQEEMASKLEERKIEVHEQLEGIVDQLRELEDQGAREYVLDSADDIVAVIDTIRAALVANQLGTAEENLRNAKFKISETARRLTTNKELYEKGKDILGQAKSKLKNIPTKEQDLPSNLGQLEGEVEHLFSEKRFDLAVMKCEEYAGCVSDWEIRYQEDQKAKEKNFKREKAIVSHTLSEIEDSQGESLYPNLFQKITEAQFLADKLAEEGQWDQALLKLEEAEKAAETLLDQCDEAAEATSSLEDTVPSALRKELTGIQDILTGLKTAVRSEPDIDDKTSSPTAHTSEEKPSSPVQEEEEVTSEDEAWLVEEDLEEDPSTTTALQEIPISETDDSEESGELEMELELEEESIQKEAESAFFNSKEEIEDVLFSVSEDLDSEEDFALCEQLRHLLREAQTVGTNGDWKKASLMAREVLDRIHSFRDAVLKKRSTEPAQEALEPNEEPIILEEESIESSSGQSLDEIIEKLSEMSEGWGVSVSRNVLSLIASEMQDRPNLHGDVLQSILSRSLLTGQRIDVDLARDVLDEYRR